MTITRAVACDIATVFAKAATTRAAFLAARDAWAAPHGSISDETYLAIIKRATTAYTIYSGALSVYAFCSSALAATPPHRNEC